MLKDYEIAHQTKLEPITVIANKISSDIEIENYGKYKAKISAPQKENTSHIILVTSINPTPYGEGKTTVAIGLHDALRRLSVPSLLTLREPSLGPVFGIKGGATGGGYAQVVPMEDINLHFTGDFHAITTANNLIAAMIDNVLFHGNELDLDPNKIYFTRTMDLNDRSLRNIEIKTPKYHREEKFTITAASELMNTFCMAKNLEDLRERLDKIIIGKNKKGEFVYVKELNITGSLLALLKEAMKPNLVQTLEHNPVIIHGGPFANLATGCNSIRSLKLATSLSPYVITEAGFGFDLGGFKFVDILTRQENLPLSCIVLVMTIGALKHHGTGETTELKKLQKGLENLHAHIDNLKQINVPFIITLNKHPEDTEEEISLLQKDVESLGYQIIITEVFEKGGEGALELAKEVIKYEPVKPTFLYKETASIKEKIEAICTKLYHANKVVYTPLADEKITEAQPFSNLPICIAKTQYSISDQKDLLGYPKNYEITVKDIKIYNGSGYITVLLGDIMTMPGLSKTPAACQIDVVDDEIINIF